MSDPALFIFGLGYVGQHLARALIAEGWRVGGTTRTPTQAEILKDHGIEAMIWEGTAPFPSISLEGFTHILVTIPPDEMGDVVLRHFVPPNHSLLWVGYLSATSVYGDHQGAWVSETSPLKPISSRGQQRHLAEIQWLERMAQDASFPLHIFRLSGIYGPGRSPLAAIQSGTARRLDKPGHVFSRIHVVDIVSALKGSMAGPQPGEIYNLSDDEPAATADVIAYSCDLLGVDVPPLIPFEEADISMDLREFYSEHKKVSNAKIKNALKIHLTYSSYREGLPHC